MKKLAPLIAAVLLVCALPGTALAAEPPGVVIAPQAVPALYPVEITEYSVGDTPRICKVYTLAATDDPANIPTADFEREGYVYTLLDMTRRDMTATDTKPHAKTVTAESKSKDMEQILPLFAATLDANTEDGYTGVLTLDPATIKAEVTGYGTSSRTVTATRTYPALSDADTSYLPKTTQENGRTLELADVQWQEAEGFYTATATYTGKASSKYATGYTVTADYAGEVSKTTSNTVCYTAIFGGTPITPEVIPFDWNSLKWLALPIGAAVVLLAVGTIRLVKNKTKRRYNP